MIMKNNASKRTQGDCNITLEYLVFMSCPSAKRVPNECQIPATRRVAKRVRKMLVWDGGKFSWKEFRHL